MMSPLNGLFRATTTDVVLDQIRLDKGQRVFLLYGAANRDEQTFPRPIHVRRQSDAPVIRGEEEGDRLPTAESGQDAAVVLALPGHTPGSIAVHLPGERVILTGDLMANFDGRITLGQFNTDREQARESVLRLAALDVEAAGFGHGEAITRNASAVHADWTDVFA